MKANNNALDQKNKEHRSKSHRDIVYSGKVIDLYLDTVELPHITKKFEIINHTGSVAIIPIDKDGNLIFINQWRRSCNEILVEIPAGTIEKNESALECAKREIQEEISYSAKTLIEVGGFYSTPGFCNEYVYLFLASDLYESSMKKDPDEGIDIIKLSEKHVEKMIIEKEIKDAKTVAGFFHYKLWKNK